jgi:hypothetical protein
MKVYYFFLLEEILLYVIMVSLHLPAVGIVESAAASVAGVEMD